MCLVFDPVHTPAKQAIIAGLSFINQKAIRAQTLPHQVCRCSLVQYRIKSLVVTRARQGRQEALSDGGKTGFRITAPARSHLHHSSDNTHTPRKAVIAKRQNNGCWQ